LIRNNKIEIEIEIEMRIIRIIFEILKFEKLGVKKKKRKIQNFLLIIFMSFSIQFVLLYISFFYFLLQNIEQSLLCIFRINSTLVVQLKEFNSIQKKN